MLLAHKGRFQRLEQQRLSGNRGLSVRPETQTIFSTAKIKLGEGAYQRAAPPQCLTRRDFFTPHIRHSMAKRKRGEGKKMHETMSCLCEFPGRTPKRHVRDMKRQYGCQVDFCAYRDKWIHARTNHKERCMTERTSAFMAQIHRRVRHFLNIDRL